MAKREANSALRKLLVDSNLTDFSSNDYLGFAKDENIHNTALRLLSQTGQVRNGATGSRLLTGSHLLYEKLENRLSDLFEAESALVFNSGYDANVGFFSSVPQRGDIIFYDEFIHASIRDGIKLSNAQGYKFKHNNLNDLQIKCLAVGHRNLSGSAIYIITESVFSMDGDSPDLQDLAKYCSSNRYHLVVDEAHAIGVLGKNGTGLVQELEIQNQVFARIITFGKALGCHGAAILGNKNLIGYLINFARSFIYTTALPPHSVATILVALDVMVADNGAERLAKLKENIIYFRNVLEKLGLESTFVQSGSSIHSAIVPGNINVKSMAKRLADKGFDLRPILSPSVPKGKERLRFCLHSSNSEQEILDCLTILAKFIFN